MKKFLVICAAAIAFSGARIYADCPGGNCPANSGAAAPNYSGWYYPGWSWVNPYGWAWGYGNRGDTQAPPAAAAPKEDDSPQEKTKDEEGAQEVNTAAAETIEAEPAAPEAEKKNHLVFSRRPGVPERNEFVMIDRQGQCLAVVKLFWKDPEKKNEIGVSVTDADVDGIKTWRKELWDKIQEGMEEEE